VSPEKTNEIFDVLRAACSRQFGFNPRRITAGMRYIGTEGHGKELVQVFRDSGTHSQMTLKGTFVTLREAQGEKPHWNGAEKAFYRSTDAEIDAEIQARQAELDFTRNSPLYQDHRAQLLSHYKDWPDYRASGINPREAARMLVDALVKSGDPRLSEFSKHIHSQDPERLAHLLLAPCHLEIEACRLAANTNASTERPTQG